MTLARSDKSDTHMLNRLTFTRFFAALAVVLFHFHAGVWPFDTPPLIAIVQRGNLAVNFFYVLSGFIMSAVYHDLQWRGAPQYWVSRLARLYPMYLISLVYFWWIGFTNGVGPSTLALSLLQAWVPGRALSGNVVAWSLSVELWFYLLFPLLIAAERRMSLLTWCAGVAVIWGLTQAASTYEHRYWYTGDPSRSHDLLFYFPPMHLCDFLIGMTAGRLLRARALTFGLRLPLFLAAVAAVLIAATADLSRYGIVIENGMMSPAFAVLVIAIYAMPLGLLSARPLRFLGDISYAIYVMQEPVFSVMRQVSAGYGVTDKGAAFWLYLAVLLMLSAVLFVVVETPARTAIRQLWERIAHLRGPIRTSL
jgi:peptidoglycan/LPS O-acetylase OafA/YrhL